MFKTQRLNFIDALGINAFITDCYCYVAEYPNGDAYLFNSKKDLCFFFGWKYNTVSRYIGSFEHKFIKVSRIKRSEAIKMSFVNV